MNKNFIRHFVILRPRTTCIIVKFLCPKHPTITARFYFLFQKLYLNTFLKMKCKFSVAAFNKIS